MPRGLSERQQPQRWTITDGTSMPAQQADSSEGHCPSVSVLPCVGIQGSLLQVCCWLMVHLASKVCIRVCSQLKQ